MRDNLVTACEDCNLGKANTLILEDDIPALINNSYEVPEDSPLRLVPRGTVSLEEVLAARTVSGGWTRATLEGWGVPWPLVKGWKWWITEKGDTLSP